LFFSSGELLDEFQSFHYFPCSSPEMIIPSFEGSSLLLPLKSLWKSAASGFCLIRAPIVAEFVNTSALESHYDASVLMVKSILTLEFHTIT